jgi:hypothetical protein
MTQVATRNNVQMARCGQVLLLPQGTQSPQEIIQRANMAGGPQIRKDPKTSEWGLYADRNYANPDDTNDPKFNEEIQGIVLTRYGGMCYTGKIDPREFLQDTTHLICLDKRRGYYIDGSVGWYPETEKGRWARHDVNASNARLVYVKKLTEFVVYVVADDVIRVGDEIVLN